MIREVRVPSFGEQLIGIDSREEPTNDLETVKYKFAEIAEILKKNYETDRNPMKSLLFDHAIGEILNAQMSVVKVLTFKYREDEVTGE